MSQKNHTQSDLATLWNKPQEQPSTKESLSEVWVAAIFKKFQMRYSYKWTKSLEGIELDAVNEWSEQLAGLSGEQIKTGLDTWEGDWPPSTQEFKKSCLGINENLSLEHQGKALGVLPKPGELMEAYKSRVRQSRG